MAGQLLHGQEHAAFGDAGYQGVHKRLEAQGPTWHVAMRPGTRRKLNPFIEPDFIAERVEKMKASIRAKVEHPFRVLKRQFGFTALSRAGQEHGADHHAVRAEQSVDGQEATDAAAVMSVSAMPDPGSRRLKGRRDIAQGLRIDQARAIRHINGVRSTQTGLRFMFCRPSLTGPSYPPGPATAVANWT